MLMQEPEHQANCSSGLWGGAVTHPPLYISLSLTHIHMLAHSLLSLSHMHIYTDTVCLFFLLSLF